MQESTSGKHQNIIKYSALHRRGSLPRLFPKRAFKCNETGDKHRAGIGLMISQC